MTYETLEELACNRISDLVDQLVEHQANGDEVLMAIVHAEIKDLTAALDSEDAADNFFYATDYRYLN
jgi:hypothetical protein